MQGTGAAEDRKQSAIRGTFRTGANVSTQPRFRFAG